MKNSSSKFKRDRSEITPQFTEGLGRHDTMNPNKDQSHFRVPASLTPPGNYTRKSRVEEFSPKQDFSQYSRKIGSCYVSRNDSSIERKLLVEKKRPMVDSVGPYANWNSDGSSTTSKEKLEEVLKLFHETLKKLKDEAKLKGKISNFSLHIEAAVVLGKHKWINTAKRIGPVPGVEIGDRFRYRAELYVLGLHIQFQKGIDYMRSDGILLATSIVATNKYSNEMKSSDELIYSGEGGNPKVLNRHRLRDQVLERGNLALRNSMDMKSPVRVVLRGMKSFKGSSVAGNLRKNATSGATYVYDGLYLVENMFQERGEFGKLVFKFKLRRISGQSEQPLRVFGKSGKDRYSKVGRIVNDISNGKEKLPVAVVNNVDDEKPPQFIYIVSCIGGSSGSISNSCDCIDQCSSFEKCCCKAKIGQQFPYDDHKRLVSKKPCIYECGHYCKCSDSCNNRVGQLGIQLQLEVFKTESKGWGVRSRSYIRAGTFICEYAGEVVRAKKASQNFGCNEFLFDIAGKENDNMVGSVSKHSGFTKKDCKYTIDAGRFGNVGRFINHSCRPNLQVQSVIYDSEIGHIMLFANKDIAPWTELTYDYKSRLVESRHMIGNLKAKKCLCRSPNCVGKFY